MSVDKVLHRSPPVRRAKALQVRVSVRDSLEIETRSYRAMVAFSVAAWKMVPGSWAIKVQAIRMPVAVSETSSGMQAASATLADSGISEVAVAVRIFRIVSSSSVQHALYEHA